MKSTINRYIDHTLLKPESTEDQVRKLCEEALKYSFFSVCINPTHVSFAKNILLNSSTAVCTVIGFPLGANTTAVKVFETENAIKNGATEIDMVINIGAIKSKNWELVESDIRKVKEACGDLILKVIFETCLLSDDEIIMASQVSERAGANFIKTSTGFSTSGATAHHVALMKKSVSANVSVKASGGVRDLKSAEEMIKAGATRLGTSSGVAILEGLKSESSY